MKHFEYAIRAAGGLQVHMAGQIAKIAKAYAETVVTLTCHDRTVDATHRRKLLGLGAKHGDVIAVRAEGPGENAAIIALSDLIWNDL